MQPEVRYCRSADGSRIAYTMFGRGEPALVVVPGWGTTFQLELQFDEGASFYRRLSEKRMVVRYDPRGIGASSIETEDYSAEAHNADLQAVVAALGGLERYDLFGGAYGSPIALLHAHRHPDKVRRVVLWAGYSAGNYTQRESSRAIVDLINANWPLAARMITDLIGVNAEEMRRKYARSLAALIEPRVAVAYIESRYDVDVSDVVEEIAQPVLLLHRRGDPNVPVRLSRELASRLPNARLVELPGDAEWYILDHQDYLDRVDKFLSGEAGPAADAAGGPSLRTVLFTDLAGHTEMMSRLGDERGRQVLREHERITRDVLRAHGGTEVKTMGDGFMASFGSVTKAVECAIALQRAVDERNQQTGGPANQLSVRCGLNAGEPIEDEGDLFGATVILASRIAAKAEGGEILVADTVRGLCAGKGFLFSDRGEFVAKGFEEPVRVYAVKWRE